MNVIRGAIENTVSITSFNRGLAGKIFGDVKRTGSKVVMKNNVAECVLMSPEKYIFLMNEVNDARLLATATDRMQKASVSDAVTQQAVDKEFGFDQLDVDGEIEFE